MQPVPRIFVSATSRDLRTARGLVSEGLRRMECLPIVQDDFPPDYKSVRDMLRTKISTCNAVVHLAGFYYGAEPQPVLPGPDRRSFTQMEYEIAMELKLPCYVFLCGQNFPFDPHDPEPEDKQQIQTDHRARLLQHDELFYEFASPEELSNRTRELQLSVENLRKELAKERARRRLAMVAAFAALVIAIVGGIWMHGRQKKTEAVNVQQSSEIAALKAQLEGPWVIVSKVNAAIELAGQQAKGAPEEIRGIAIKMVAAELKKPEEEVSASVDSATQLLGKLVVAARAEGQADPSKREENRQLEIETLKKLGESHEAAARYKEALAAYAERFALLDREKEPEEWLDALCSIGDMEDELGRGTDAGAKYRQGVEFGEAHPQLGIGHRLTIFATGRLLIYLLYTDSDLPAAEKLMRRVLKARESALGPEAPATLSAMGELGDVLAQRGMLDESQALVLGALKTSDRIFGPEHATTMKIVSKLSAVLQESGDLDGAIQLQRRVVAYRKKEFGAEDPSVLSGADVLGSQLEENGDLKEAKEIYLEVFEIREKTLGPEHPDTLDSMESVASIMSKEEDYAGAEKVYRRALKIREKVQGPDHPDTIANVDSLAMLRWDQEDHAGAEKLYGRVFETWERTLGPDHATTIDSLHYVALMLTIQKKYDEAEPLDRRVFKAREKALSATDPELASACHHLALVLVEVGKEAEAAALARRAVAIAEKALPEKDETRIKYEQFLAKLTAAPPPKPAKAPPSAKAYLDFRKELNDKSEGTEWKQVKKDLPNEEEGRRIYLVGWFEGKALRKILRVDARGDSEGTFTGYYWLDGEFISSFRVRNGAATKIDGVAKATDTYNYFGGKLVGWKRTQDDNEKEEDPAEPDSIAVGKRVATEAREAAATILKAAGTE